MKRRCIPGHPASLGCARFEFDEKESCHTAFEQESFQTGLTVRQSCALVAKVRFDLSLFYGRDDAVATTVVFLRADAVEA